MEWVEFAAVMAFIACVGWRFWDWMTGLHQPRVCTGCQRHAFRPGCPIHDEERRKTAA